MFEPRSNNIGQIENSVEKNEYDRSNRISDKVAGTFSVFLKWCIQVRSATCSKEIHGLGTQSLRNVMFLKSYNSCMMLALFDMPGEWLF